MMGNLKQVLMKHFKTYAAEPAIDNCITIIPDVKVNAGKRSIPQSHVFTAFVSFFFAICFY